MPNMKRIREARLIRQYYMKKFAKETGNRKSDYHGIFVKWDELENKYCLRGENVPAHPDMVATYPNGWSLLDYLSEDTVSEILGSKPKTPKTNKRILSVKIKRMADTDPDTSYLGEYSNRAETEYAIDRAHSEDCIENDTLQKEKLERIANSIENDRPVCEEHLTQFEAFCETCEEERIYTLALDDVLEITKCDCGEHGDMRRNEFRYFNESGNYKGLPDADIRKYVRQDYERMESLNAGHWCYLGIRAEACVSIPSGSSEVSSKITSCGLWGIESDSDKSYLESVEKDELSDLREQLKALGFSSRAISTAFNNVERMED